VDCSRAGTRERRRKRGVTDGESTTQAHSPGWLADGLANTKNKKRYKRRKEKSQRNLEKKERIGAADIPQTHVTEHRKEVACAGSPALLARAKGLLPVSRACDSQTAWTGANG
jgi:hypothetical protein